MLECEHRSVVVTGGIRSLGDGEETMTEILYGGFTLDQVENKFANQTDEHKGEIAQDLIVRIRELERRATQVWLPDLLCALGWAGGTIHQALHEVRRLKAEVAALRYACFELRAVIDEKDKLLSITPQDILDDAGGYPWMRDEVIRLKRVSALLLAANAEIARRPCSAPDRRTNSACDCCSHHWLYQEPLGAFDGRTFEEIR